MSFDQIRLDVHLSLLLIPKQQCSTDEDDGTRNLFVDDED